MHFTKTFKERDDLLTDLETAGLQITDRSEALGFLKRVGYHRSGAYRYVFRDLLPPDLVDNYLREYRHNTYIAGASIDHVMSLEAFDMGLSRVCLDGILDFEIRLRAAIAHALAKRGVAAHLDMNCLDIAQCQALLPTKPNRRPRTKFQAWEATVERAIESSKADEDFIKHHLRKYPTQPLPVWAVTEVLSFGNLPFIFDLMKTADARAVALEFGFQHPAPFGTVIRAMADFRNYCAHGSRLFNRHFKRALSIGPWDTVGTMLDHLTTSGYSRTPHEHKRLYINAALLAFMLKSHSESSDWPGKFQEQVESLNLPLVAPDGDLIVTPEKSMGFPDNWPALVLWQ